MIFLASNASQYQMIAFFHYSIIRPSYDTENRLNDINFSYDKILKVIQSLDPNKVHDHDGVSVRMLKLCCPSIIKPLFIIFCNCLKFGTLPDDWKKGNIVPVHKKSPVTIALYSCYLYTPKFLKKFVFDAIFGFKKTIF